MNFVLQKQSTTQFQIKIGGTTFSSQMSNGTGQASQWFIQAGAPSPTLGRNADCYLNITTGQVYRKEAGAWVLKGTLATMSQITALELVDAILLAAIAQESSDRSEADEILQSAVTALNATIENMMGNVSLQGFAGQGLESGNVVYLASDGKWYKGSSSAVDISGFPIALCTRPVNESEVFEPITFGFAELHGFVLTPEELYYCDVDGLLTTTKTRIFVGIAITESLMMVKIDDIGYSRLSDIPASFTPSAHTHTIGQLTDAGNAFIDRRGGNYYRRSQRWYLPSDNASTLTNVNHTTPSVFFVPMVIEKAITIDAIAVEVVTAGFAGSSCRFGIYNGDASLCVPTTLIVDSGDISTTVAVKTVVLGTPITLQPGLYFTAFSTGSSTAHQMRSLAVSSFSTVIGQAAAGGANQGSYINGTRAAYGALPANANTLTALNATQGQIYGLWHRIQ